MGEVRMLETLWPSRRFMAVVFAAFSFSRSAAGQAGVAPNPPPFRIAIDSFTSLAGARQSYADLNGLTQRWRGRPTRTISCGDRQCLLLPFSVWQLAQTPPGAGQLHLPPYPADTKPLRDDQTIDGSAPTGTTSRPRGSLSASTDARVHQTEAIASRQITDRLNG